jgi:hypothetical protein
MNPDELPNHVFVVRDQEAVVRTNRLLSRFLVSAEKIGSRLGPDMQKIAREKADAYRDAIHHLNEILLICDITGQERDAMMLAVEAEDMALSPAPAGAQA